MKSSKDENKTKMFKLTFFKKRRNESVIQNAQKSQESVILFATN